MFWKALSIFNIVTKVQGQLASEDRVETNGQTDGGDCITSLANAIGNEEPCKRDR